MSEPSSVFKKVYFETEISDNDWKITGYAPEKNAETYESIANLTKDDHNDDQIINVAGKIRALLKPAAPGPETVSTEPAGPGASNDGAATGGRRTARKQRRQRRRSNRRRRQSRKH
jgi:hypothetical protein